MKPKFLKFPLLALALASSAMAGQFIWTGATDSTWSTTTNWDVTTSPPVASYPVPGSTYAADFLNIKNNGDLLPPTSGSTPGFNAIYDPGAGVTTTFNGGRCFTIGTGTVGTKGFASLEIKSGTIVGARTTNTGSEAYMANRADTNLLINGGNLDLSGQLNNFRLIHEGMAGITSTLTINSGSLSCRSLDLVFDQESQSPNPPEPQNVFGTGIINLNGGTFTPLRITRTAASDPGQTSFTLNLNGGTLRPAATITSGAIFLDAVTDLTTLVKLGGAIIDTNGFNASIAESLEHDPALGVTLDGGLTKNGAGNLTLSGANTYTGGTTINAGRIIVANDNAFGTAGVTMANTSTELQIAASRTIASPLVVSDTGNLKTVMNVNTPGCTWSGPVTINETGADNFQVRSDSNCFFTVSGKISGAGGIYKYQTGWLTLTNSTNDFTGGVKINAGNLSFDTGALGTTGTITMDGGTLHWQPTNDQDISSRLVMVNGKTATISLSDGGTPYDISNVTFASAIGNSSTASLAKNGNGTLTLTQPSTYTGGSTLTGGTISFPAGGLGTTGNITMNGGTLRWETGNTEDVSARLVMVASKTATFSTNGNDVTLANSFGSAINGNLTKTGGGTLILTAANTYTGNTSISSGTLQITSIKDYGVNSAIGAPASGDIQLGSSNNFCNLIYTGAGDSTNRTVKLGDATAVNTGVGSIKNNGTGALTFTAANFNPAITGITATRTLWLGGTYVAGSNGIQGIIQDNDVAGKVNVGKGNDASMWLLSGANTYTGSTIVQGGTLKLGAAGSIASSTALSISAGATLDTSAQATHTIPGTQPVTFGIDATGSGSSGKIEAAGLNVSNAAVTYNITGTPDDPIYVLATYTSLTGTFASVPAAPAGYTLNYAYQGDKIALVQATSSPYQTWAGPALFTDDANGDGVKNGLAWILGATDPSVSALDKLPVAATPPGYLTLSFKRVNPYSPAKLHVEYSNNLTNWTKLEIPAGSGTIPSSDVEVVVTPGSPEDVTVKIPNSHASGGKLFGRLSATEN